jgi:hypothetical protein
MALENAQQPQRDSSSEARILGAVKGLEPIALSGITTLGITTLAQQYKSKHFFGLLNCQIRPWH